MITIDQPKCNGCGLCVDICHEGCLSLTGYTAIVPRAARVHVDGLNERAEAVSIDAEGWYARILQHEIDHLNGVLFIDRMNSRSFMTQENHLRFWKDKFIPEVKRALSLEEPG